MTVFLATLGQRPEAITMALDVLIPRYHYHEINIIHTDITRSDIKDAYQALMDVLQTDYVNVNIKSQTLYHADGSPLIDIADQQSAEAYYMGMLEILRRYRADYQPIHLLISGGRKAMSVYATLAASIVFGEHDRVWTIITPHDLMKIGMFHVPVGHVQRVQVVQLPMPVSRFLPGELAGYDAETIRTRAQTSPRTAFLHDLTDEETNLAELLRQHPYLNNADIAQQMGKSLKTVETQLTSIYDKMLSRFDLQVENKRKRQALIDVLAGRV